MSTVAPQVSAKFKPYAAYRESGVEWLGEVPEHWQVKKLRHVLARNDSGVWGEDPDGGPYDRVVLRSTEQTVGGGWAIEDPATRKLSASEFREAQLGVGDLVVTKSSGSELHIGKTSVVDDRVAALDCAFSNFMQRLRPRKLASSAFLAYWLNTIEGREQMAYLSNSTTGLANLSGGLLARIVLPLPPIGEQRSIVSFLDRETAKIDALIEKKRRMIELLKEKRAALISHAVTKGLDLSAPMKDSGIPWLGPIPAHWSAGNLRRFALMRTGHTPSRSEESYWVDCDIPWFTLSDIWQVRDGKQVYLSDTKERISAVGLAHSAAELLPAGTVVFSRTASVGFSGVMSRPMATSQDFWNWVPGPRLLAEFLLFQFRAMRDDFLGLTNGSTHKTVYQGDAASICVTVPPLGEQEEIIRYVSGKTQKLDALEERIGRQLGHLQEFRSALISAAVTGKIDVRHEG